MFAVIQVTQKNAFGTDKISQAFLVATTAFEEEKLSFWAEKLNAIILTADALPDNYVVAAFAAQTGEVRRCIVAKTCIELPVGADEIGIVWTEEILQCIKLQEILFISIPAKYTPYDGVRKRPE